MHKKYRNEKINVLSKVTQDPNNEDHVFFFVCGFLASNYFEPGVYVESRKLETSQKKEWLWEAEIFRIELK